MKFRSRTKIILLILLVVLNIALRVPSIPHESGLDSFSTHILANSISNFGYAKWWVNPFSIFGYYPASYPSAIPFILSGLSQSANMDVEKTIWLFSLFIGILSIFISYLLAGLIEDNDLFKFLVAFGFSSSQAVLNFSTWDISTRGPFLIFLPMFIYILLRIKHSVKNLICLIIISILLTAIHHLVITISIFLISAFILATIYIIIPKLNIKLNIKFGNILILISFIILFLYSFKSNLFIEESTYSSKYDLLQNSIKVYVRYIGPLMIFFIGGFAYQIFKPNKKFEENFILFSFFLSIPFIFYPRYGVWFIIIFLILFAAHGLLNLSYDNKHKFIIPIICFILLISVSFSTFYQHWRTSSEIPSSFERHLTEKSFSVALWIRDNINGNLAGNDELEAKRIFAISQVPTFTGEDDIDLTYGFENISDLNISKISPSSLEYYAEGPYIRTPNTPYAGYYFSALNGDTINGRRGKSIISKFNISYVIENNIIVNNFIRSIQNNDKLYDNGKIRVWSLK